MNQPLLSVKNLKVHFPVKRGRKSLVVHAVDGISFDLYPGETLAMVGESGCGKSTAGRAISRLIEPTSGSVELDGENILNLKGADLKKLRSDIQMVFQDPASFFDPRMTVGETLMEPFEIHRLYSKAGRKKRVEHLLQSVGLDESFIDRLPSECSGGQKQRVGIARALALNPKLIIADEPVSALDVLIQAQILNLFQDLKKQFSFSYLFISHDLSVVRQLADRVAVMYLGKIVESAPVDKLFSSPQHPYTQALLAVIPKLAGRAPQSATVLEGELPNAIDPPSGCSFHTRCPYATERCKAEAPVARVRDKDHLVACHLSEGGQPDVVGA